MHTTTARPPWPPAFEPCLAFVKTWEGGWSDHEADPGGRTRWGITWRTAKAWGLDLRHLTEAKAETIFHADYWQAARCADLPPALALLVFDAAVNQGPGRAVRFLQKATGARPDGIFGPATRGAVTRAWAEPDRVLRDFAVLRALHYSALLHFVTFGRGWLRRLFAAHATAQLALQRMEAGEAPGRALWQAVNRAGHP